MIAATVANSLNEKTIPFSDFLPDWSATPDDAWDVEEVLGDGNGS